jgi:hypothetical protein
VRDYYTEWCAERGCDHAHCPDGCEHPQPVMLVDGRLVCGRCLFKCSEVTEMVPCSPEVCKE